MSTKPAIVYVAHKGALPPDRFTYDPNVHYVFVDPEGNATVPSPPHPAEDPATDYEWEAVIRNSGKINKALFRVKVADILRTGTNLNVIAAHDEYPYEELWEVPSIG